MRAAALRSGLLAASARIAVLGLVLLAAGSVVLLVYAELNFLRLRPDYYDRAWPTFSRVLSIGDLELHRWIAAAAGLGLFFGTLAIAPMRWVQAREAGRHRVPYTVMAVLACVAAPLGIVYYFLVTITLSGNNPTHMLVSYVFFFGMTGMIVADIACAALIERRRAPDEEPPLGRAHRRIGWCVLLFGALFLATFLLKDFAANPWRSQTQKTFVFIEIVWVLVTQVYGLFYVRHVRRFFGPGGALAAPESGRLLARTTLLGLGAVLCLTAAHADAATPASTGNIGGSGRIQPANGVIVVAGSPGRAVERVAAREGERVRKGAVLIVFADEAARALERDVAQERLRNAERQVVERHKIAELEVEAARVAVAQAQNEASALAGLDERTIPTRERQSRAHALAQAKVALELALARQAESKKSVEAELRIAAMNVKLAQAALTAARVLAPADATVLEVNVQAGSSSGGGPAMTLADTSQMYVVADFFEGDLPRLAPGQRVKVSNATLGAPLDGAIERVGRVIDPVNRLAKVWVKLDRTSPADRFIGMQVDVKVDAAHAAPKPAP